MANEIYNSSYWGNGVCDNAINWGVVYKDFAGCTPTPDPFTNTFSLAFDGVDDFVNCGNVTALNNAPNASWSFWMKPSATGLRYLFSAYQGSGSNQQIRFAKKGTGVEIRLRGQGHSGGTPIMFNESSQSWTLGSWYHIAVTFDGAESDNALKLKVYVNGSALTNTSAGSAFTNLNTTTSDFHIASFNSSNEFAGNIDEFSIYDYTLTQANVNTIFNSGVPNNLANLTTPPIHWWRMGDNGSYKSTQWLIPNNSNKDKVSNYSFELDGVDDSINCGANSSLQPTTGITLSTWFMIPTGSLHFGADTLISQDHIPFGGLYNGYYMEVTIAANGYLYSKFSLGNGTSETSVTKNTNSVGSPPYVGDTWYHLCGTWDGSNMTLYINGVSLGTTAFAGPITYDSSEETFIGNRGHNQSDYFVGSIDEVSIFNVGKNATEVADIYNSGTPTTITGAVAHYKMGEEATFSTNWTVPDQVGSNDGTSANMTIEDRTGNASSSTSNAVSFNMTESDRETDVPT